VCKENLNGAVVDDGTITRTVTFQESDFTSCLNNAIADIDVRIRWQMVDTDCDIPPVFGFSEEAAFRIISPMGTFVDIVQDAYGVILGAPIYPITYQGFNSVDANVIYDDQAAVAAHGSGNPMSGSFRPHNPFTPILGESPIGTWTLVIGDGSPGFPMCYREMEVCITCESIVPVEMSDLVISASGKTNELTWTTYSEVDNRGFFIEGLHHSGWDDKGFVPGHGNSNHTQKYKYIDNKPGRCTAYRLRQEDYNGQFRYSEIVKVNTSYSGYLLLGNQYRQGEPIRLDIKSSNELISIYNHAGALMYNVRTEHKGINNMDLHLPRGIYFMSVQGSTERFLVF
jgi:hypothetical protein